MKYEPIISGNYYHIYNRGNNREDIFKEERNYDYFIQLMQKHVSKVVNILSYCLLKNHFHLLIYTKENIEDRYISQKLSNFFNAYSKGINNAYNRTGSLFQDRFARKQIDNEDYLRSLIIYIHTNPEHHQFTDDFKNYKYSSYHKLMSDDLGFLDKGFVIGLFDEKENFEYQHRYVQTLKNEKLTLE